MRLRDTIDYGRLARLAIVAFGLYFVAHIFLGVLGTVSSLVR